MKAEDIVFNGIYGPAMKAGATERAAKDSAVMAMNDYKKGKFKNINTLIKQALRRAKAL